MQHVTETTTRTTANQEPVNLTAWEEMGLDAFLAASSQPVVIDFWAPWCGPCKAMNPVIEAFAQEQAGTLRVIKVNVDEHPDLAVTYQIRSIPTLLFIKDGEVVDRSSGSLNHDQLQAAAIRNGFVAPGS